MNKNIISGVLSLRSDRTFVRRTAGGTPLRRGFSTPGLIIALIAYALAVSGCGTPGTATATRRPSAAELAKKPETTPAQLPGALTGTGWHIPLYVRDPKNPTGPLLPVMIADAQTGAMTTSDRHGESEVNAQLHGVKAKIFHEGKQTAEISAPQVTTNQITRVLVATGGVTIRSVNQKSDVTITADKVVWDTHTTKVIATGHPHIVEKMNGVVDKETTIEHRVIYYTDTGATDAN